MSQREHNAASLDELALAAFRWGYYRHFKGGLYRALDAGYDAADGAAAIRYRRLTAPGAGRIWFRRLRDDWLTPHPDAPGGVRYTYLEADDPDHARAAALDAGLAADP